MKKASILLSLLLIALSSCGNPGSRPTCPIAKGLTAVMRIDTTEIMIGATEMMTMMRTAVLGGIK